MDANKIITDAGVLSKEVTDSFAARRVLTFFRVGESGSPSKRKWALGLLKESGLIEWDEQKVYDIAGRLLFRDKFLSLRDGMTLFVRTAASELLSTPVWSLAVGSFLVAKTAAQKAVDVATKHGLSVEWSDKSLVCYSYPKLGLLCVKPGSNDQFIVDIGDLTVIPVSISEKATSSESLTCWSPFDRVSDSAIGTLRHKWQRNVMQLPMAVDGPVRLEATVRSARESSVEKTLELNLRGQQTPFYCAVAVAEMILEYNGILKSQHDIATVMHTRNSGTENADQVAGYGVLSSGNLTASYEEGPSFSSVKSEIDQSRPVKSGVPGHARACAGYKIEGDGSEWIYINDPWPVDLGASYWESWDAVTHTNFIYVKRTSYA